MTPQDPQWRKKKPDINEPVPIPERLDPMVPMHEEVLKEYKPLKKWKRGLRSVRPSGQPKGQPFNQGRIG